MAKGCPVDVVDGQGILSTYCRWPTGGPVDVVDGQGMLSTCGRWSGHTQYMLQMARGCPSHIVDGQEMLSML